jgi:flagellar biosynthesis/type III secretory pathway protein FliH
MLDEVLRNTPAYQRILKKGRDEGLEEGLEIGLEKGLQKGRQEAYRQELLRQREALLDVIRERFPKLVRQVRPQINAIEDTAPLLRLIVKIATVTTAEEAQQLILDASEEEEQD